MHKTDQEKMKTVSGVNAFNSKLLKCEGLGVSHIIWENLQIINKTDSQNQNIMPDLMLRSKVTGAQKR